MVAAYVVPARAAALRDKVTAMLDADGLWCGPEAASDRCREGLVAAVISGGVGAVVVDAAGFDDATHARAACLRAVFADADEAEVDLVLVVRDDACAARDEATAGELARLARTTPSLRCAHADAGTEPLTVLAAVVAWCWAEGGGHRRDVASALMSVHLV